MQETPCVRIVEFHLCHQYIIPTIIWIGKWGNEYRAIPVQKLPDSVLPSFEAIFFQRPGLVTDGSHPSEQKTSEKWRSDNPFLNHPMLAPRISPKLETLFPTSTLYDIGEILSFLAKLIMHWYLAQDAFHRTFILCSQIQYWIPGVNGSSGQMCGTASTFKHFLFIPLRVSSTHVRHGCIAADCSLDSPRNFYIFFDRSRYFCVSI